MKVFPMPELHFNNRLRSTAGICHFDKPLIELNTKLFDRFPSHFVNDVIPHEFAHYIAEKLYNCHTHGKPWKSVCVALGVTPEVYNPEWVKL